MSNNGVHKFIERKAFTYPLDIHVAVAQGKKKKKKKAAERASVL